MGAAAEPLEIWGAGKTNPGAWLAKANESQSAELAQGWSKSREWLGAFIGSRVGKDQVLKLFGYGFVLEIWYCIPSAPNIEQESLMVLVA